MNLICFLILCEIYYDNKTSRVIFITDYKDLFIFFLFAKKINFEI